MTGATDGEDELESLRSACRESRAVLDHVNETLDDIADKGVWTARTAVLVLGIVVSALSIGPPMTTNQPTGLVPILAGVAIGLLFLSTLLGLGLYLRTENEEGIGETARTVLLENTISNRAYRRSLLQGYQAWIRVMDDRIDRAGTWLYLTWFCLSLGLVLLTVAAVLSINGN